jgi:hypothetical protein
MELTTLKGTEKQVNWAKAIRKDRLKVWQGIDSDSFQDAESMLAQQDVASWWIANKDKSLKEPCGQLKNGTKSKTPGRTSASSVPLRVAVKTAGAEVWETVVTVSGFRRSGQARDLLTGEVVNDATLPF